MSLIRCLHITNALDARFEMRDTGVDAMSARRMEGKALHLNLKVERVDPRTANLLKQAMINVGGDGAVDRRGIDCSAEKVGVILMGTHEQMEQLALRMLQSPDQVSIGKTLRQTLKNLSKTHYTLRCRKKTLMLDKETLVMGVLNVTPDSFFDGGLYLDKEKAVAQGLRMVEEGADILDIGGESTRPGSKPLELEEELRRVIPVIESLAKEVDVPISIDTYKSAVAREAIRAGAQMINDISGLHFDPGLALVAAGEDIPLILMHVRGTPETMQKDVHYESLLYEIIGYLKESIERAESAGLDPQQIVVDPGIGFGKTVEDNLLIIKNLSELRVLGKPILLGTSRKSFIGKTLNAEVGDRLEGALATIAIGALHGAHIVRCHDVLQSKKAIALADAIRCAGRVS